MRRREEDAHQRAVVELLGLLFPPGRSRVMWFHVPNGGGRSKVEASILKGLGVQAGVPDIILLWGGGCAAIELKAAAGRTSPAQREWLAQAEASGVPCAVCRDVGEVHEILKKWGIAA